MPSGYKGNSEDVWDRINKKGKFILNLCSRCWEWTGCIDTFGYGYFRLNGKGYYIHRFVWELMRGIIPKNLCVLHHCDNPKCCNPNHLFLGTRTDNNKDMISKGRYINGNIKLTQQIVDSIRNLYATNNYTQQELSDKFNIPIRNIQNIIYYKNWKVRK
jgi:hypothetical protein